MVAAGARPQVLTTDLGGEFVSKAAEDRCSRLGLAQRFRAPEAHVQDVESSHRRLFESARPALIDSVGGWIGYTLDAQDNSGRVCVAYHTSYSDDTNAGGPTNSVNNVTYHESVTSEKTDEDTDQSDMMDSCRHTAFIHFP